jgi:hypothetical protein
MNQTNGPKPHAGCTVLTKKKAKNKKIKKYIILWLELSLQFTAGY